MLQLLFERAKQVNPPAAGLTDQKEYVTPECWLQVGSMSLYRPEDDVVGQVYYMDHPVTVLYNQTLR